MLLVRIAPLGHQKSDRIRFTKFEQQLIKILFGACRYCQFLFIYYITAYA